MIRSPLITGTVRRSAHRRLRRAGGTQGVAWALRVPLVTLVVACALLTVMRHGGPRRP